jgi:hypothetical protein
MPNSIKYSTTGDTQSLRDGNFYIGTGDVGKGPTSSTGHWNGITPPSGGYTVYKNKVSNGPAIWTATSDNQLISLTNNTEGTSFTGVQQCINYYTTQSDKMVFNKDYEGIITNGLVFNVDAGFLPSYSTSGNTWYDLAYSGNNGTLVNGVTYSSLEGGSLVFDGTNDYVDFGNTTSLTITGNSISLEAWVNYNLSQQDWKGVLYKANGNSTGYQLFIDDSEKVAFGLITTSGFVRPSANFVLPPNTWHHIMGTYDGSNMRTYINGTLYNTFTQTGNILASSTSLNVGRSFSSEEFPGYIPVVRIYNRGLTSTEVLKNYNAGLSRFNTQNIVKSNLVLNLDSSISVSYPTTGTTWTDLSGYGNKGTLTNGPTFDSTSNSIVFDGTDDFVSTTSNVNTLGLTTSNGATMVLLLNITLLSRWTGVCTFTVGSNDVDFGWDLTPTNVVRIWKNSSVVSAIDISPYSSKWVQYTLTSDNSGLKFYVNDTLQFTNTTLVGSITGGTVNKYLKIMDHWDNSVNGKLERVQIYDRSLTLSEIQQNYYQAPISTNNLALAIDPGNLVSYPGTGTTLNGLSPSGYTATLTNGPTYSSANGGTIVLDGVDDTITTNLTRVGYSNTTQIIWYKWDGVNKIASIMYLGDGGSTGYGFIVHDGSSSGVGNKVGILYGGSYYNAINVGTTYGTLVSGVWTQLAVTRDSTTTYLYQNGVLLGYTTRNPNGSASTLSLGISSVVGGSIGPALFYNRALSADEVAQNYNAQKSRFGL